MPLACATVYSLFYDVLLSFTTVYYFFTQNHIDPLFRTASRGSPGVPVPRDPFLESFLEIERVQRGPREFLEWRRFDEVRGSWRKLEKVRESWRR